jgi:hypothetical protein
VGLSPAETPFRSHLAARRKRTAIDHRDEVCIRARLQSCRKTVAPSASLLPQAAAEVHAPQRPGAHPFSSRLSTKKGGIPPPYRSNKRRVPHIYPMLVDVGSHSRSHHRYVVFVSGHDFSRAVKESREALPCCRRPYLGPRHACFWRGGGTASSASTNLVATSSM